jgi:hypothetical protein
MPRVNAEGKLKKDIELYICLLVSMIKLLVLQMIGYPLKKKLDLHYSLY